MKVLLGGYRPNALLIALALLPFAWGPTLASTVTLDTDDLPSAQGWLYEDQICAPAKVESDVFTAGSGLLQQNTIGCGFSGSARTRDRRPITVAQACPFTIDMTARVLSVEGNPSNVFGFTFGVNPDGLFAQVGAPRI